MIDEQHEELASLHALDLLEGSELAQFEKRLGGDPELQALVASLREAAAAVAHTAPAVRPPATLKDRVLASIEALEKPAAAAGNVIRPSPSVFRPTAFIPWAVAASLVVATVWLGQRYMSVRTEAESLQQAQKVADLALRETQQQLEAERIIARRQMQETQQQVAATGTQLETTRAQLTDRERQLAEARDQTAERERLIAETRNQLTTREREIATLTQRIDIFTGATEEIGRKLGEAQQQVARLTDELKSQGDLATFKITALASLLKNSPQALAVAVWDPGKQEGVLKVEKLPALLANQDYQLWIVDPQYPNPVDGGVFTVDPAKGERTIKFKAKQPVGAVNAFAVTLERKGGVPKAEGPFVLLGK
ncbi:MAG: anti-sigma factor [Opitutaceae bacterium]